MFHLIQYTSANVLQAILFLFQSNLYSLRQEIHRMLFNIHLTIEFILPFKKCCKCLNKWKSVSAKSGEYGGRITYNKNLIFFSINFEECGRALSCISRIPCLYNNAGCGSESFSCICWVPAKCFSALIVSPDLSLG